MSDRVWMPRPPMNAREIREIQDARQVVMDGYARVRQREPRQRDVDYMGWIAQLPCTACLAAFGKVKRGVHVAHVRLTDAEHGWRGAGMQERPHDRRTVPLCPGHHTQWPNSQHKCGDELKWWRDLMRIDVFALCADLSAAFDAGQPGYAVIAKHAAEAAKRRRA